MKKGLAKIPDSIAIVEDFPLLGGPLNKMLVFVEIALRMLNTDLSV